MKRYSFFRIILTFSTVFFVSCEPEYNPDFLPVLVTSEIKHPGPFSTNSGGHIISDGGYNIVRRGVCWSTNPNPTINHNNTVNGRGIGMFESSITNLDDSKTYYIRAYATNRIGTAYGQEIIYKPVSHFNPDLVYGTVTDQDGNTYKTITIGNQTWMAENLKTTTYRNGDKIKANDTQNINGKQWTYDNKTTHSDTYGRLYTWYALNDIRNIAPVGWKVPTKEDWSVLTHYLIQNGYNFDNGLIDNKIAKSVASRTIWGSSISIGAVGNILSVNNTSGLSLTPGGYRDETGLFRNILFNGYWWCSTEYNDQNAWYMFLGNNSVAFVSHGSSKLNAFAVRCILEN